MAIKKGAFELYTQERQLPAKVKKAVSKKSHFFDEIDVHSVEHKSVHNRFTKSASFEKDPDQNTINIKSSDDNPIIGSQLVHNQFTETSSRENGSDQIHDKIESSDNNPAIGSQSVHNRFTEVVLLENGSDQIPDKIESSDNNPAIGSQSVHNRFTETVLLENGSDQIPVKIESSDNNPAIGSQSVHNRFTEVVLLENGSDQIPVKIESNDDNPAIGSQSVHNRFTEASLKKDSNHKSPKIESSAGNQEIGSQLVHNRFTSISSYDNELERLNLENNNEIDKQLTFSKIIGNQRSIVISLYKNMKINKSDSTEKLTLDMIANLTGINPKSLKNTLFRLTSAGILIRTDQKIGRGGWVKYKVNMKIIKEIQETFV